MLVQSTRTTVKSKLRLHHIRTGCILMHDIRKHRIRRGVATLDYALVMGIILPLATILFWVCPQIMNLVYEMTCVLMGAPFP